MKKLPWSNDEYTKLKPEDLDPSRPPTPEQRIRVAAALATMLRDGNMLDDTPPNTPNAEAIRSILTMSDESWQEKIEQLQGMVQAYDTVDGMLRFEQTVLAS